MPARLRIPNGWEPRHYQLPLFEYLDGGGGPDGKRAACVWHRRSGKDDVMLNYAAKCAIAGRPGTYWHVLPYYSQARRSIWDSKNREGARRLDQAFPEQLRTNTTKQDMKIELPHSIWQCVGADNLDALMGANPIGIVLSEWSIMRPRVWDRLRPILLENGGWAVFIYTPRGRNHGMRTYNMARANADWFASRLTVHDTGVLTDEQIEAERAEGMSEELIQQEYFVSFDAPPRGAIFREELAWAQKHRRFTRVPPEPGVPVDTVWDLGWAGNNVVLLTQTVGLSIAVIGVLAGTGAAGVDQFAAEIRAWCRERGLELGKHYAPHDIDHGEWGTGEKRIDVAKRAGLKMIPIENLKFSDGLDAARRLFRVAWVDAEECSELIDALWLYRRVVDEELDRELDRIVDDWTCHYADAWRYLGVIRRKLVQAAMRRQAGQQGQVGGSIRQNWDAR